jgi:endoglucanase
MRRVTWRAAAMIVVVMQAVAASADEIRPPLSTRGAQIVDRAGRPVVLRGISWFGMETETHVPHGIASWGTDDPKTDFRLAAERCGDAIHAVAPHWLIVVEGVEKNVPGQQLPGHWWGGNLEGARRFPVRLKRKQRLVYSPHEYGPGVHQAEWFRDPAFPANLPERWDKGFYFLVREQIAPVLVGEFGGRETGPDTPEGVWQRAFVEFLREKQLGFIYWSWNPNSGDTGGLVADDWRTLVEPKRALLAPLLDVPRR